MVQERNERKEARKLGVVLGGGLLLFGAYLTWKEAELAHHVCFAAGGASLLLTFALPGAWLAVFRRWMVVAEAIGWVMTRVILSVFFFLMLTPVGVVMRLLGKNPLDVAFKDGKKTYWVDKPEGEYTIERYRKQY